MADEKRATRRNAEGAGAAEEGRDQAAVQETNDSADVSGENLAVEGAPVENKVEGVYVRAGRTQTGEVLPDGAAVSTKAPRGVGEPAANAEGDDVGIREAQRAVTSAIEAETRQGFRGDAVDPTPNEHYTVAGVTQGLPTPETTVYTPRGR